MNTNLTPKAPEIGDVLIVDTSLLKNYGMSEPETTKVPEVRAPGKPAAAATDLWEITIRGSLAFVKDNKVTGSSFFLRKPSGNKLPIRVEYYPEFRHPTSGETVIKVSLG
jgi:hypothetical protein